MGIIWDRKSPTYGKLENEGIPLKPSDEAVHQDIRPLEIAILNLMPNKEKTEEQYLRLIGDSPLQIAPTFMTTETYNPKNVSAEHLRDFYTTFSQVRGRCFDALMVTGAPLEVYPAKPGQPLELMPYEEVNYWEEFQSILDWARTNVTSTFFSCWGAMAGLYHYYGVPKHLLPEKKSGVFRHQHNGAKDLFRNVDQSFLSPHSRHAEVRAADVSQVSNLEVLAQSPRAGLHIVGTSDRSELYVFGHPEYDVDTLHLEYTRDLKVPGLHPSIPENYYPEDNPQNPPQLLWRANGASFMRHWVDHVYQKTPFKLEDIPASRRK